MWFHKTNCYRAHRCRTSLPPHLTGPGTSTGRDDQVPLAERDGPPRQVPQVLPALTATAASSTPVTTTSALVSQAGSTSVRLSLASSATNMSVPSTLNPNAHQFLPQPPSNVRKTRQTQNISSFTPEKAEIESLKIELSYARTKIVDLQTKNKDHEHTIEIYSQKIKLLEDSRFDALHAKYFSPTSSNPSPSSDSSWFSDCPCQIRAQISKNSDNLKNIETKLSLELQQVRKRLEEITRSEAPTPPQPSQSPPTSTSIPRPSPPPSPPRQAPAPTPAAWQSQDVERSFTHPREASRILETRAVDETLDAEASMSIESEFDFSESFNFPDDSPKISLN